MVRCHRCLALLFLFRGRSSGYQIFAASLTHNASLDKAESLFTVAGYSFVAFSFKVTTPRAPLSSGFLLPWHFNLQPTGEISSYPPSNLRQLNVLDRRKILRRPFFLFFFSFFPFSLHTDPRRKTDATIANDRTHARTGEIGGRNEVLTLREPEAY